MWLEKLLINDKKRCIDIAELIIWKYSELFKYR